MNLRAKNKIYRCVRARLFFVCVFLLSLMITLPPSLLTGAVRDGPFGEGNGAEHLPALAQHRGGTLGLWRGGDIVSEDESSGQWAATVGSGTWNKNGNTKSLRHDQQPKA